MVVVFNNVQTLCITKEMKLEFKGKKQRYQQLSQQGNL